MAKDKTVTPGHVVETSGETALDNLQEGVNTSPEATQTPTGATESASPDITPPETPNATEDDMDDLTSIVLVCGGTFNFRGQVFKKGEAKAVAIDIAERLVKSGYFERR